MKHIKVNRLWPVIILIISYGYIFHQIMQFNWGKDTLTYLLNIKLLPLISLQIILLSINILSESYKWKLLISPVQNFSLKKSVQMVLAGFTSAIFTPGKLGEPIGRNLFLKQKQWITSAALNYFGGIIQNAVIFTIAFISSFVLYTRYNLLWSRKIIVYSCIILGILFLTTLIVMVFKTNIKSLLYKSKILEKMILIKKAVFSLSFQKIILILIFNIFRYFVFSSQLFIMFYYYNNEQINTDLIFLIPIYYMGITILPSFMLIDLGVRNSVALFLFTNSSLNAITTMLCVSTLWVINQGVPSLLGSYFFYRRSKHKAHI